MKSLQNYIDTFSQIATNLNLTGDSVELLVQMLANATYISEVENVGYMNEASLEKATLTNSKIQHCVNNMYSVYRGTCPRVIVNFVPTTYFDLNVFDELLSGNGFKVYYLGYYSSNTTSSNTAGTAEVADRLPDFQYSPLVIPPDSGTGTEYTLIGLLAKETAEGSWEIDESNTYYVNCLESNLSSDMWVKIDGSYYDVTREFSSHILDAKVFDLTLPDFGSRLYVADILRTDFERDETEATTGLTIEAKYYKLTSRDDYNDSDLKKLTLKGATLTSLTDTSWMPADLEELGTGLYILDQSPRNDLVTIHYKANRDRYVNSIVRSNSDIGTILEEMYPEKVMSSGTSYKFSSTSGTNSLVIYYVPTNSINLLTDTEKEDFINSRMSYYITDNISVMEGTEYTANFAVDVELYQNESVDSEVADILDNYENAFNVNLSELAEEIKALISKISNVKVIRSFGVSYTSTSGDSIDTITDLDTTYFKIKYTISSVIS